MAGVYREETVTLIVMAKGRKMSPTFLLLLLLLPPVRCQVFVEQHEQIWRRGGLEQESSWSKVGGRLEQESSCYFQPFYKQLTCKCPLGQVCSKDFHLENLI